MDEKQVDRLTDILTKNWNYIQILIQRSADRRWIIKGGVITSWLATCAYAYDKNHTDLILLMAVVISIAFWFEAVLKVREEQLIQKNKKIEAALTSIALGDADTPLKNNIIVSTNLPKGERSAWFYIISRNRYRSWGFYLVMMFFTFSAWVLNKYYLRLGNSSAESVIVCKEVNGEIKCKK